LFTNLWGWAAGIDSSHTTQSSSLSETRGRPYAAQAMGHTFAMSSMVLLAAAIANAASAGVASTSS
jgi:hypothetical protein